VILAPFVSLAEVATARLLNSIPEGILIAFIVWIILRLSPRQDSGMRFAAWFLALLAVIALPFAGGLAPGQSVLSVASHGRPLLTLPDHWAFILFITWLLIACLGTLRLAVGVWRVHGLLRTCSVVNTSDLEPAIRKIITEFCSSKSATIATSEKVSVPTAIGFMNPKIVIPRWALRELTPQALNNILLHEFAHLQRWDGWTNLLQKFLRSVFCFHPAVWWIESRLSLEREMACDDYVVAQTKDGHGYAKCLIGLLERRLAGSALAMAQSAVRRTREAAVRIAQILDGNRANTNRGWKPTLALVGAFSLLCLVVLPGTRHIVGFAANDRSNDHDSALLPVSPGAVPGAARVIPARIDESSVSVVRKPSPRNIIADAKKRRAPKPYALMARAQESPGRAGGLTVRASQIVAPMERTVLVIQTTSQLGPDSWGWSIHVWQLTMVPDRAQNAVNSKKT